MASVLPNSSLPMKSGRRHWPACMEALASGMWRAAASRSAIVCSAAEMTFEFGALHTMTPRSEAASMSMLSTVTPARPMIFRFSAASSRAASTTVFGCTMSAS